MGILLLACSNKGCNKKNINYPDYYDHLINCNYRKYKCTNNRCYYVNNLDEIKKHCRNCPRRKICCKFCKKDIVACEEERHSFDECSAPINCELCGKEMKRWEYFRYHKSDRNQNVECLKTQLMNIKNKASYYEGEIGDLRKKNEEESRKNRELESQIKKYKNDKEGFLYSIKNLAKNIEGDNYVPYYSTMTTPRRVEKYDNNDDFFYDNYRPTTPMRSDYKSLNNQRESRNDPYSRTQNNFYSNTINRNYKRKGYY